ncbi:Cof-type HAD-IIB family hydrolase [Aerococcaceae bacterium WGS1372]
MTNNIELIAIDLDGTLLRDDKTLVKENIQAISEAIEQGVRVVICTGRTLPSIEYILEQLPEGDGDEYLILQNGAVIYQLPNLEIIHETVLTKEDRQVIYDTFMNNRRPEVQLVGFDVDNLYLVDDEEANDAVIHDSKILSTPITHTKFEEVLGLDTLYKFVAFSEVEHIDHLLASLPASIHDEVHVVRSLPVAIEFIPKLANKANGLKALLKELNLEKDKVMAIGDELNDLEMIDMVGLGVVMANGHPDVKAVADYITLTNEEAGVAYAIRHFVTQPPHNS